MDGIVSRPAGASPAPTPVNTPVNPTPQLVHSPPTTTIKFNVPGERSNDDDLPKPAPLPTTDEPTPDPSGIVTFDRNSPPPIAERAKNPTSKKNQGLRDIISIGGVLLSALLLAFCLITFVFQSYQVDGPSMQTTLQNSDHLIVWKVGKTWANITHQHYIPNRGDVVVFNEPGLADLGQDGSKQLIKRVIGKPGERVTVKDGVVTVYNKDNPDGFQPDKILPYGNVITNTPGNVDVTLGEGQVFVCGDNRTNSLDSRVFGPVDSKYIVGKLVLRVLPLNSAKKF